MVSSRSAGFSEGQYRIFLRRTPQLLADGAELCRMLAGETLGTCQNAALIGSLQEPLHHLVLTANLCAPTDLWLLRQALFQLQKANLLNRLMAGQAIHPTGQVTDHYLPFLHSRGYLHRYDDGRTYAASRRASAAAVFGHPWTPPVQEDIVPTLVEFLLQGSASNPELARWLGSRRPPAQGLRSWPATAGHIELGARLVPLLLAMHHVDQLATLGAGALVTASLPDFPIEALQLLHDAGITAGTEGRVSELGAFLLRRAPGPFGIIYSYLPMVAAARDEAGSGRPVDRLGNIAASQEANSGRFRAANDSLDRFCRDTGFRYSVFIEHALGRAEATRQRFERSGAHTVRYVGADLEPAVIAAAGRLRDCGLLPAGMILLDGVDISRPEDLLTPLHVAGLNPAEAVMMIGNGLHEMRDGDNERMVEVLRRYRQAGILLIFTEEALLDDDTLRRSGWNTYHAGFRLVHQLSGQKLRPAQGTDAETGRWSWQTCVERAGYHLAAEYCTEGRPVLPFPLEDGRPVTAISKNYFCLPQ